MKRWKTVKSKVAYKCRYFRILEEDFTFLANSKKSKYYILDIDDYAVIIAKDKNFLYLVEFYRYPISSVSLEFPKGRIEKGKSPVASAKKELKEEAGITADKIRKIGWFYSIEGFSNQKAHIFLAENLNLTEQNPDMLERAGGIKIKKVKISKIKSFIRSGKINNIETVAAFNLFLLKYKNSK